MTDSLTIQTDQCGIETSGEPFMVVVFYGIMFRRYECVYQQRRQYYDQKLAFTAEAF